jgi:hypothetical protein
MAKDDYRFLLRLPQELRGRLTEAATESGRSLNAEIVHRLGESLEPVAEVVQLPQRRVRPVAVAAAVVALAAAIAGGAAVGRELTPDDSHASRPVVADGDPLVPRLYPWVEARPDTPADSPDRTKH